MSSDTSDDASDASPMYQTLSRSYIHVTACERKIDRIAVVAYRLPSAILAHDEGQRTIKLNNMLVVGAEAAHALDEELVDGTHAVTLPGCCVLFVTMLSFISCI